MRVISYWLWKKKENDRKLSCQEHDRLHTHLLLPFNLVDDDDDDNDYDDENDRQGKRGGSRRRVMGGREVLGMSNFLKGRETLECLSYLGSHEQQNLWVRGSFGRETLTKEEGDSLLNLKKERNLSLPSMPPFRHTRRRRESWDDTTTISERERMNWVINT